MTALKPCLAPGETLSPPCLSDHDHCTVYRYSPSHRWCCKAREMYDHGSDHGTASLERLREACLTLKARSEGFREVPDA